MNPVMTNSTKKLLLKLISRTLFVMVCMMSLAGCKKQNPEPPAGEYYMKFKLDGAQKDYRYTVVAYKHEQTIDNNTVYGLSIAGVTEQGGTTSSLTISIATMNNAISKRTYQGEEIGVIYVPSYSQVDISYGADGHHDNFSITIDEIDSQHVKGKFSGKISRSDGGAGPQPTITEGVFYAPVFTDQ